VPVRDAAGKIVSWTGARAEAARLVTELPAPGREAYELLFGARARALLTEARDKRELSSLEEAARRYFHSEAGVTATRLLALHHLDRGHPRLAAACFSRL